MLWRKRKQALRLETRRGYLTRVAQGDLYKEKTWMRGGREPWKYQGVTFLASSVKTKQKALKERGSYRVCVFVLFVVFFEWVEWAVLSTL